MRKLRILYAGNPVASAMLLEKLIQNALNCDSANREFANCDSGDANCEFANYEFAGVLTNPPSARGRHKELLPTEVAQCAASHGIPVFSFEHLDSAAREAILPLQADLLLCFDYGRIFGPKFLAMFPLGGINLHPSLLPKYRGCTPVPAALLNGDEFLGVSVQKLALKTDEGDILGCTKIPLNGTETTQSLMDGDGTTSPVIEAGFGLLSKILADICASDCDCKGNFVLPAASAQCGESSYTPFIKKEDGRIDWSKPAVEICRKIRAYTPWPGCFTSSAGIQLKILKAFAQQESAFAAGEAGKVLGSDKKNGIYIQTGNGVLVVSELQWEKKKAMDFKSFLNGSRDFIGTVLE